MIQAGCWDVEASADDKTPIRGFARADCRGAGRRSVAARDGGAVCGQHQRSDQTDAALAPDRDRHAVREAIEAAQARLLFLPPYRPDLNPIERVFAKLEAMLRRTAARSIRPCGAPSLKNSAPPNPPTPSPTPDIFYLTGIRARVPVAHGDDRKHSGHAGRGQLGLRPASASFCRWRTARHNR